MLSTCGCGCGCGWGWGCGCICGCIWALVICAGLTRVGGWRACVMGGWPIRLAGPAGWPIVCCVMVGWPRVCSPPRPGGWIMLCWTGAYWGCCGAPPSTICWPGAEGCCPRRDGCSWGVGWGRCCHGGGAFPPPNCAIVSCLVNICGGEAMQDTQGSNESHTESKHIMNHSAPTAHNLLIIITIKQLYKSDGSKLH